MKTVWLIENRTNQQWWTGVGWTSDATKAHHYPSENEAINNMAEYAVSEDKPFRGLFLEVTEHQFG